MNTYAEFDKLLHRGDKPVPSRKIANNTYAQRRGNCCESPARMYLDGNVTYLDCIAIRFHDTDVVTFHNDGVISLDSGGWLTMATQERMNRFLPEPLRVHSVKGRWMLATRSVTEGEDTWTRPDYEHSTPFADGTKVVQVYRPGSSKGGPWVATNHASPWDVAAQDAHNARIEKLLDAYLRWLQPEYYEMIFGASPADCGLCVRTGVGILAGDSFEDKQHLIEHLIDKTLPFTVFHVACDHGYGGGDGINRARHFDIAKRDLRKYLRQQLYVGPVAIKGGKRPAHTAPWSMTAQMSKPKARRTA